jgi:hypothetical protein
MNLLESECETCPPAAPNHENDSFVTEPPPLPPIDDMIEEDPPSPLPGPAINDISLNDLPDDQRDPPPGPDFDEDLPPPGPGPDEDNPPPGPSPDEDPHPSSSDSDSDEDEDPPPDPDEDEDLPLPDADEEELHLTLEKMKTDHRFIEMARAATLASQFNPGELLAFQNTQEDRFSPSDGQDLHLSINFYISSLDHAQSQKAYAKSRSHVLKHIPMSNMLSYDQVKRRVSDLSGIVTWKHDMCFNIVSASLVLLQS